METYTVALVGCGPRGLTHLRGFRANSDRFTVVGLCDRLVDKLESAAAEYGIDATYADAEQMLAETKPDVFCFATFPDSNLELVELGVRYGARSIAFEKPMANSLEAMVRINSESKSGIGTIMM